MPRKKRDLRDLLPTQQNILKALKELDRSVRWLAQKIEMSDQHLWQKIWVNEKIDAETVEKIANALQKENPVYNLEYFMPSTSLHFSIPGNISREQGDRIKLLGEKLKEVSKSADDTELVLSLVDRILTKK